MHDRLRVGANPGLLATGTVSQFQGLIDASRRQQRGGRSDGELIAELVARGVGTDNHNRRERVARAITRATQGDPPNLSAGEEKPA